MKLIISGLSVSVVVSDSSLVVFYLFFRSNSTTSSSECLLGTEAVYLILAAPWALPRHFEFTATGQGRSRKSSRCFRSTTSVFKMSASLILTNIVAIVLEGTFWPTLLPQGLCLIPLPLISGVKSKPICFIFSFEMAVF